MMTGPQKLSLHPYPWDETISTKRFYRIPFVFDGSTGNVDGTLRRFGLRFGLLASRLDYPAFLKAFTTSVGTYTTSMGAYITYMEV